MGQQTVQAKEVYWGAFTLDALHVGSPVGGEFAGSHGLRILYGGNKRVCHSLVICMSTLFNCFWNDLIVHIL